MSTRWKVVYALTSPTVVVTPVAKYASLDVAFQYDPAGLLESIEHQVDVDDAYSTDEVRHASDNQLALLWSALEFRYGIPWRFASIRMERVGFGSSGASHGLVMARADAVIVSPVQFPSETALVAPPPQLALWLQLANWARRCSDNASAIRTYYLVIEDRFVAPPHGTDYEKIKLMRDFASHAAIGNPAVINLVRAELGLPSGAAIPVCSPTDPSQKEMLKRWRDRADKAVAGLIDALLQ